MFRSTKELNGYVLQATDGEIGRCEDFLFDDDTWTVRYMVADTGKWIPNRKVLVSPISLGAPDWGSKLFPVHLNKEKIENAPRLRENEPVSRQQEMAISNHYGYPHYWAGANLWGMVASPAAVKEAAERIAVATLEEETDPHLRSVNEVTGYAISATDGEIGHVEEFVLDEDNWSLRYMVVDTRNWLPGRKVLLSPVWVSDLDWIEGKASVDLTKSQIKSSPEYNPDLPINREYETRLYDFYGRPVYW